MFTVDEPVYVKVGRRYKEVGRHLEFDIYRYRKDNDYPSAVLMVFDRSMTSYLESVEPDKASVLAAMKLAKNAMVEAMLEASRLKPTRQATPITAGQRMLLDKLEATGFNTTQWTWADTNSIIEAGMKALEEVES